MHTINYSTACKYSVKDREGRPVSQFIFDFERIPEIESRVISYSVWCEIRTDTGEKLGDIEVRINPNDDYVSAPYVNWDVACVSWDCVACEFSEGLELSKY